MVRASSAPCHAQPASTPLRPALNTAGFGGLLPLRPQEDRFPTDCDSHLATRPKPKLPMPSKFLLVITGFALTTLLSFLYYRWRPEQYIAMPKLVVLVAAVVSIGFLLGIHWMLKRWGKP